jgi:hypothetical protein
MICENDLGVVGLSHDELDELDELDDQPWHKLFYPDGIIFLVSGEDDRFPAGRMMLANF